MALGRTIIIVKLNGDTFHQIIKTPHKLYNLRNESRRHCQINSIIWTAVNKHDIIHYLIDISTLKSQ